MKKVKCTFYKNTATSWYHWHNFGKRSFYPIKKRWTVCWNSVPLTEMIKNNTVKKIHICWGNSNALFWPVTSPAQWS